LYANRNGTSKAVVEQARVHLAAVFAVSNPYIMTLTRAVYNPGGLDDVITDYGLLSRKQQQLTLVGSNGYIKAAATQADDAVHALLETSDSMSDVNDIFRWVMGKDAHLYRINNTPSSKQERLVVLGVVGSYSFIYASNIVVYLTRPLLGVRSSAKN
ncbi:hypothetical protein HZB02_06630, partial [Candidatus Woesearchaeota archaeon]|nr:hypothetical protein [Candidatus Woesearchaeota archaeon]